MRIKNMNLMEEYYQLVQQKYPHLTFDEVKLICLTPFTAARSEMQSPNLPTVRFKYLGTFVVFPKKADALLRQLTELYKENRIDHKQFFRKQEMLNRFLTKFNMGYYEEDKDKPQQY